MGLFDFFNPKKQKSGRPYSVIGPSTTKKRETPSPIAPQLEHGRKKSHRIPLKVTDTKELENNLKVETQLQEIEMTFYCPVIKAKIFCHSVLVDKLGGLTKFIISSIHKGYTIEEICTLTQMGNMTIEEELDYLIRGGLIKEDRQSLTELGSQYGVLLEKFSELFEGIDISFNVFANQFETIEEDQLVNDANSGYVLEGHFIPALTRNDNYANSLEIAKNYIEPETPFCKEIRDSLYTTVRVERGEPKYRKVYVRDFSIGADSESDLGVRIAIPCDVVTYKPRYRWVDAYREVMSHISALNSKDDDLLSDKAGLLINTVKEENDAEEIVININTITGQLFKERDDLGNVPKDSSVFVLELRPIQLGLEEGVSKGIYLHEMKREHLYKVNYYPYSEMEV